MIPRPTMEACLLAVAHTFGQTPKALRHRNRGLKPLCTARHAFVLLAKTQCLKSFPDIGRYLGGRDHTTALNSFRKAQHLRETDGDFATRYLQAEAIVPKVAALVFERRVAQSMFDKRIAEVMEGQKW